MDSRQNQIAKRHADYDGLAAIPLIGGRADIHKPHPEITGHEEFAFEVAISEKKENGKKITARRRRSHQSSSAGRTSMATAGRTSGEPHA